MNRLHPALTLRPGSRYFRQVSLAWLTSLFIPDSPYPPVKEGVRLLFHKSPKAPPSCEIFPLYSFAFSLKLSIKFLNLTGSPP
jgi:hypothetical protein